MATEKAKHMDVGFLRDAPSRIYEFLMFIWTSIVGILNLGARGVLIIYH